MNRARRRLLRLVRRIMRAWQAERRARARRSPIRAGTVLYESFAGNGALCNPEALFRELLRTPDVQISEHLWVLDHPRNHRALRAEFARTPTVKFVRRGSSAYFRALATSQYLINNATFPAEFSKRAGQIYLNTWHGTPLKRMGYDMPDGAFQSANTLRNFLAADYLLSQNAFMTSTMYESAYRLRGRFRGSIIEEGYPRVDHQFGDGEDAARTVRSLAGAGIGIGPRHFVLYAPTWRGASFSRPVDNLPELVAAARDLQAILGDRYRVALKLHQSAYLLATSIPEYRGLIVPNDIPTNSVLAITDLLVTDYSSTFFDYLASNRPIVFYTPDTDEYAEDRGTYLDPSQLPGPVLATITGVASAVEDALRDPLIAHQRSPLADRFVGSEDGRAAARVIDVVFRGARAGYRVLSVADKTKTSLLIHLGGMRSNGITSSALNLLSHLDHDAFDVSVTFGNPTSKAQLANQAQVDPRATQLIRTGGMDGSKLSHLMRRLATRSAHATFHSSSETRARLWDDEWTRCYGDSRFDLVVDFSGYSPFWATLLLHSPDARRSIWMHNDMAAEQHRIIRGKRRMFRSLRAVFALYAQYDALVSVSPALRDLNQRSLASGYGLEPSAFQFATNVINEGRVIRGAKASLETLKDHPHDETTDEIIVPDWVHLLEHPEDTIWFCSVGRFSTEKNQARLIRAFAMVHEQDARARLIIVGYGPLRDALDALIAKLGLTNSAYLVGPYSNPFPIVATANCFVLSSNYEGQPMVLLEAAIVGIPIVSVRFASVDGALADGVMLVVDQTDEALAEGMRAYLRGEVPAAHIDANAYNAAALEQFSVAIGTVGVDA